VALSRRLLSEDEHLVVATRTHVKALLVPAMWLILVAAVAGYASSFAPSGNARPLVVAAIWVVALVAIIWLVVKPFLAWLTTTYTVTDRRLITRSGILSRRGHDIPLLRVSDVAYEHGILDRLLGCGTLVVSTASERGQVRLPDIPHVEHVHLQVSDLLYSHDQGERRLDDGT
jgi:uncharacterized membrane protein YdbT with pleckstrin-like domain